MAYAHVLPGHSRWNTFIGLQRNHENRFVWDSGSTCSFRNWNVGEPNNVDGKEPYVELYSDGSRSIHVWNDCPLTKENAYICERKRCPD
ncbi:hypothetical protein COOONC_03303 [Cooperia oncophora]